MPQKLVSSTACASAKLVSSTRLACATPALLTSRSMRPLRPSAISMQAATEDSDQTSNANISIPGEPEASSVRLVPKTRYPA